MALYNPIQRREWTIPDLSHDDLLAIPPDYMSETNNVTGPPKVSIVFIVLTTLVYLAFMTSRIFCAKRNFWELWVFYPLSYLSCLAVCIICFLATHLGGAGRHIEYWLLHSPATVTTYLKTNTAVYWAYMAGVTFPKICILTLYIRLLSGATITKAKRRVQLTVYAVLAVVVVNYLAIGIALVAAACTPYSYNWDKSHTTEGEEGRCIDVQAASIFASVANVVTDMVIFVLPFCSLYDLNVSLMRKVGIIITFLTGSLGIVASILRFVVFAQVGMKPDIIFYGVWPWIYTVIEPCSYFICACLPGTRPLLGAVHGRVVGLFARAGGVG